MLFILYQQINTQQIKQFQQFFSSMSSSPKADQKQARNLKLKLTQQQAKQLDKFISQLQAHHRSSFKKSQSFIEYKFTTYDQKMYDNFKKKCQDKNWSFDQDTFLSKLDAKQKFEDRIKQFKTQFNSSLNLFFGASWVIGLIIANLNQSPCLDYRTGFFFPYRKWLLIDSLYTISLIVLLFLRVLFLYFLPILNYFEESTIKITLSCLFRIFPFICVWIKIIWLIIGMNQFASIMLGDKKEEEDYEVCDSDVIQFSITYFLGCIMIAWKLVFLFIEWCSDLALKKINQKLQKHKFEKRIPEILVNQLLGMQKVRKLIQSPEPYGSVSIDRTAIETKRKYQMQKL